MCIILNKNDRNVHYCEEGPFISNLGYYLLALCWASAVLTVEKPQTVLVLRPFWGTSWINLGLTVLRMNFGCPLEPIWKNGGAVSASKASSSPNGHLAVVWRLVLHVWRYMMEYAFLLSWSILLNMFFNVLSYLDGFSTSRLCNQTCDKPYTKKLDGPTLQQSMQQTLAFVPLHLQSTAGNAQTMKEPAALPGWSSVSRLGRLALLPW